MNLAEFKANRAFYNTYLEELENQNNVPMKNIDKEDYFTAPEVTAIRRAIKLTAKND